MADAKLTALGSAGALDGTELSYLSQSGVSKKVLLSVLQTYFGTNYQPLDSDLTAIALLSTTSFGRSILALADASALRTAAGLGTIATQNSNTLTVTGTTTVTSGKLVTGGFSAGSGGAFIGADASGRFTFATAGETDTLAINPGVGNIVVIGPSANGTLMLTSDTISATQLTGTIADVRNTVANSTTTTMSGLGTISTGTLNLTGTVFKKSSLFYSDSAGSGWTWSVGTVLGWSANVNPITGIDVNFSRSAIGEISCGTTSSNSSGNFKANNITASGTLSVGGATTLTGGAIMGAPLRKKAYTVATLPSGTQGDCAFVTDALAPSFLVTITGGGSAKSPVFYDGTNWIAD